MSGYVANKINLLREFIARNKLRPKATDYTQFIFDFDEPHGDRCYGDDGAVISGIERICYYLWHVMSQAKGKSTEENY